ncbi:hypothetical protein Tco_0456018 [Tanacetum coccineum]
MRGAGDPLSGRRWIGPTCSERRRRGKGEMRLLYVHDSRISLPSDLKYNSAQTLLGRKNYDKGMHQKETKKKVSRLSKASPGSLLSTPSSSQTTSGHQVLSGPQPKFLICQSFLLTTPVSSTRPGRSVNRHCSQVPQDSMHQLNTLRVTTTLTPRLSSQIHTVPGRILYMDVDTTADVQVLSSDDEVGRDHDHGPT